MIKTTILNTEDDRSRELVGVGGMTAVLQYENELTGEGIVYIENEFTPDEKGRAEMKAVLKEILKTAIQEDRKLFANAVYQACEETGFLSQINGIPALLFRGAKPK